MKRPGPEHSGLLCVRGRLAFQVTGSQVAATLEIEGFNPATDFETGCHMTAIRTDIDAMDLLQRIQELESVYPGFRDWYLSKVVPGVADGTRRVFAEISDLGISGVAIAKRGGGELKLCTLWKDSNSDGGTAVALARSAMEWLGTERPSFTVPADRIHRLRPVLNHFGIDGGIAVGSLYRDGVGEFLFNAREMSSQGSCK